jgi:hypothetical protein
MMDATVPLKLVRAAEDAKTGSVDAIAPGRLITTWRSLHHQRRTKSGREHRSQAAA